MEVFKVSRQAQNRLVDLNMDMLVHILSYLTLPSLSKTFTDHKHSNRELRKYIDLLKQSECCVNVFYLCRSIYEAVRLYMDRDTRISISTVGLKMPYDTVVRVHVDARNPKRLLKMLELKHLTHFRTKNWKKLRFKSLKHCIDEILCGTIIPSSTFFEYDHSPFALQTVLPVEMLTMKRVPKPYYVLDLRMAPGNIVAPINVTKVTAQQFKSNAYLNICPLLVKLSDKELIALTNKVGQERMKKKDGFFTIDLEGVASLF